ncbi:hypothetical protein [Arhodomonas sp. SL1]|uniref:hypothetical protein n=1 Tax=Arhodomonas sp. SL1 TaxID=3425691 RepID=UPI003F883CB5
MTAMPSIDPPELERLHAAVDRVARAAEPFDDTAQARAKSANWSGALAMMVRDGVIAPERLAEYAEYFEALAAFKEGRP